MLSTSNNIIKVPVLCFSIKFLILFEYLNKDL